MASTELIKAVAVTAELCGRTFSPEAAAMFVEDLGGYDERQVLGALSRCRREVRGILTVQDVLSRLDDGRPSADEAWAMLPKNEIDTVVMTTEMAEAGGIAQPLLNEGDKVGARMAFKDAYNRIVQSARERRLSPTWFPSLGSDAYGREIVIMDALAKGRLTQSQVKTALVGMDKPVDMPKLEGPKVSREVVRQRIAELRKMQTSWADNLASQWEKQNETA